MIRILIALLFIASSAFATDFDDTDQMYGWDSSTGQFYQTWADFKAQLSLLYQAKDADLDTYAGITPSANVQSLLSAADYAAIRTLLSLDGTYQAADSDLTTYAGITPSANVQSLLGAADYAAMRTLLSLGTAALLDSGVGIGNVVLWEDDGSSNASIGIGSIDLPTMADYSVAGAPFPSGLTVTELGYLDGVTSAIQTQIDNISSTGGYVAAPTYSDDTCTTGQWSFDANYHYICEATNQWDRYAVTFASWNNPAPTPPTLTSATIGADGTTFTLVASEAITIGTGGNGGWTVDCATAGADIAATYSSGDTTDTLVYTLGTTVNVGDTCTADYVQPGDGWEDVQGDDLASDTWNVTNSSTAGASSYADIIFYANADTLGTTPQKGTGPLAFGGGILLETVDPILGAGSWDNNNSGWQTITVPAVNVDWDDARIGFYFKPQESSATEGRVLFSTTNFYIAQASSTAFGFRYKDKQSWPTSAHGMTQDGTTSYFIEVILSGTSAQLLVDGVVVSTLSETTGTISGDLFIGSLDGTTWDAHYDQVIISNDTDRDIYSIRNVTDFN